MQFTQLFQAFILGIIQGVTEFIPVSSSGHLQLVPAILGWETPSTTLMLFAHAGTLIALIIYFRKTILSYLTTLLKAIRSMWQNKTLKPDTRKYPDLLEIRNVILATIPAIVIGILAGPYIAQFYDSGAYDAFIPIVTITAMAAWGLVFILTELFFFKGKKTNLAKFSGWKAFVVGIFQTFAFLRGISRSGATLIGAQFFSLSRTEAAKFSFLMSIPIIAGGSILGIRDLLSMPTDQINALLPSAIVITITSAVFGLLAIRFVIGYLEKKGLSAFGWYRIGFALFALVVLVL